MANMLQELSKIFVFLCFLLHIEAESIPGVVSLNSGTFDKIVPRFQVVLVKVDETYPYGDKQDTFKEVVTDTLSQTDLLLAEIHVADYGDKENADLAERFGVTKDDYPTYKLFVQGKKEPITYTGDVKKAEDIKRFIIKETGLWLGLPACIEEFDKMVQEFFKADKDSRQSILEKAEKAAEEIESEDRKFRANVYVKTMQKILEKGDEFVNSEVTRVEKLKDGKVSDKKKEQLADRASILTSFQLQMRDEL